MTGYGYSGVIEAVGARVVDFRVGDAVVGVASLTTKHGGLAEFTAQSPNALGKCIYSTLVNFRSFTRHLT